LGEVCAKILTDDPVPPSLRNPELPTAFDRIIARCLAKNPDHRYKTGNELARALYLVARTGRQTTPRRTILSWFQRPLRPRDFWAVASAVLLAASIFFAVHSSHDRPDARPRASAPANSPQDPDNDSALAPAIGEPAVSQDRNAPRLAEQSPDRARSHNRPLSQSPLEQAP
jgi:serine/threonine protein kinase